MLKTMLETRSEDFEVVGLAFNGQEALGVILKLDPGQVGQQSVAGAAGDDLLFEAEFDQIGGMGRIKRDDPLEGFGKNQGFFLAVRDGGGRDHGGAEKKKTGDEKKRFEVHCSVLRG